VFDADRSPIGALAVAAPVARVTDQTRPLIRRRVIASARSLTQQIGGFYPASYPSEDAA